MSDLNTGKLIVAAPEIAVKLYDARKDLGERIFSVNDLPSDTVYVFDLDEIAKWFRSYNEE